MIAIELTLNILAGRCEHHFLNTILVHLFCYRSTVDQKSLRQIAVYVTTSEI